MPKWDTAAQRFAPSAWVLQPLAAAAGFGTAMLGLVSLMPVAFPLLIGAVALSCLAWVPVRRVAEAFATLGAVHLALLGYMGLSTELLVTLPAVLVPWVLLFVELSPHMRLQLIVLQYLALVPFMESVAGSASGASNIALAIGSIHLIAVWATLPPGSAWRRWSLYSGLVSSGAIALLAGGAYLQSGTNLAGRSALLGVAAAFAALLLVLLAWGPARSFQLPALLRGPVLRTPTDRELVGGAGVAAVVVVIGIMRLQPLVTPVIVGAWLLAGLTILLMARHRPVPGRT